MSEAKTAVKPAVKSVGLFGAAISSLATTSFVAIAAWCFLTVVWGVRSLHQHNITATLHQIDSLLVFQPWISPPAWVNKVIVFYTHSKMLAMQPPGDCFSGNLSSLSHHLPNFQAPSSDTANPFAKEFSHTCFSIKTHILPVLSGAAAVVVWRLWIFITALPLFLLGLSLGLVDGLVQRDIRKFQGARESTLLFHRIKRCGAAIFFLPLLAYFAWLSPVSPSWFLVPMALSLGLWLALSVRFFKKYL